MSESNSTRQSTPDELICNLKGHIWSGPEKDIWMDNLGAKSFYYHKCSRCLQESKHLNTDCPSCLGVTRCDGQDHEEEHPCPFAMEINNDSTSLCTCCRYCEEQCAMDI